jgi:hypothetical protein
MIPCRDQGAGPLSTGWNARLLCDLPSEWSVGVLSAQRLTDTAVGQTYRENGEVGVS